MFEKLLDTMRRSKLRNQMKIPDFAEHYAAIATDDDWRFLAPRATDAHLAKLHALQQGISPMMRFSALVTALEKCCPPEDESSIVFGSLAQRSYGVLDDSMFCVELGIAYQAGKHAVYVIMTVLYELKDIDRTCYDTIAGESFEPGIYDELRATYAWLDAARPAQVYATLEEE